MISLPNNIFHLPEYHLLDFKEEEHDFLFQLEAPAPVACEECGVEGEFVRFGKRQSAYRDLPMHGKRVTLWVTRRRYICRACDKTFRPCLPEIVDGYRMTRRLHTHVEKEAFNHPYAYVADTTGLDEKTVREIFKKKAELLAAHGHKERFFHIWDCTNRRDAEKALAQWIDNIPRGQKEVWKDLVKAVSNWREEMLTYFETDISLTNAFTESINRLAKDKNRDGRGYSFEVMRARMLYTTKHKKKPPQTKESPFLGRATMTYSKSLPPVEKNYGVDLSTFWEE